MSDAPDEVEPDADGPKRPRTTSSGRRRLARFAARHDRRQGHRRRRHLASGRSRPPPTSSAPRCTRPAGTGRTCRRRCCSWPTGSTSGALPPTGIEGFGPEEFSVQVLPAATGRGVAHRTVPRHDPGRCGVITEFRSTVAETCSSPSGCSTSTSSCPQEVNAYPCIVVGRVSAVPVRCRRGRVRPVLPVYVCGRNQSDDAQDELDKNADQVWTILGGTRTRRAGDLVVVVTLRRTVGHRLGRQPERPRLRAERSVLSHNLLRRSPCPSMCSRSKTASSG